jgi:hypothetical protein
MLKLRPHHLIDIIRNIGQGRPVIPHPYGHAQHIITHAITNRTANKILLTVGADDICKPCIHLTAAGTCDDILPQLDYPVAKQQYNDELDLKLLSFMGLENEDVVLLSDFLNLVAQNLNEIAAISTHPKEDAGKRKEGLKRGLDLLISGRAVNN